MNDYNELIERCKEICDWQDTGLLKGDALRNFAASRPYAQQHNSVSIAQAETLREVADAFLVMAARVAELEAARIAYASEFPPDDEGLPIRPMFDDDRTGKLARCIQVGKVKP